MAKGAYVCKTKHTRIANSKGNLTKNQEVMKIARALESYLIAAHTKV